MIKKGLDLITLSPSKLFRSLMAYDVDFNCCQACTYNRFICKMLCKYRHATYQEFEEDRKRVNNEKFI